MGGSGTCGGRSFLCIVFVCHHYCRFVVFFLSLSFSFFWVSFRRPHFLSLCYSFSLSLFHSFSLSLSLSFVLAPVPVLFFLLSLFHSLALSLFVSLLVVWSVSFSLSVFLFSYFYLCLIVINWGSGGEGALLYSNIVVEQKRKKKNFVVGFGNLCSC